MNDYQLSRWKVAKCTQTEFARYQNRYQYCKNAHHSTKSELHFIASTMFRKDRDLILERDAALKRSHSLVTHFADSMKPPTPVVAEV